MAPLGAVWWDAVPVQKVAQRSGLVGRGGSIIGSQPREERGSSEDDNHRHRPSLGLINTIGYNKGAALPPGVSIRYRMPLQLHFPACNLQRSNYHDPGRYQPDPAQQSPDTFRRLS